MKPKVDLLNDPAKPLFFKYLLPSISATLVTSIYVLADTIMIGKGIGEDAVAGLNIILPLLSLFFGTGLLFGVGGSVLMSFSLGKGEKVKANSYFTTAVLLNVVFMVFYLIICSLFFDEIAYFLGSNEATIGYVRGYGHILVGGIPVFMFSTFLQAFVRNDHAPKLSMIGVITGGVVNVIFDYIFIFKLDYGMAGAAAATVMGAIITCIILLSHFITKTSTLKIVRHKYHLDFSKQIFKNGFSSFVVEISNGILMILFNLQLIKYIGNIGVTVYSIISNTGIIVMSLGNGISQAAQPIIAMNHGAGKTKRIKEVRNYAFITAFLIGLFFTLFGVIFPEVVINIFVHPTDRIMAFAPTAIRLYFISFIGLMINIFFSNYFQSILQPGKALIVCLLRGLIISGLFVFILPPIFGTNGIWITMPIVEIITFIVALLLNKRFSKQTIVS